MFKLEPTKQGLIKDVDRKATVFYIFANMFLLRQHKPIKLIIAN